MYIVQTLLSDGFGPIRANDAPLLYRVLLGALVLSLALAVLRAVRSRDVAQLGSPVLQVPALYAVWLAYGQGIGVAALALPPLVWSWLTRLPAAGPNVPLRLVLLAFGPYSPLEQVTPNTVAKRLRHALFDTSAIYALGTVAIAHALPSPYLTIVAIFALGIAVEGIIANVLGARGYVAGLLVTPVLLVVGMLGAANVFAGLTRSPALDGVVWIQATTVCATYSFVQFLVLWTERSLSEQMSHRSAWAKLGDYLAHMLSKRTNVDLAQDITHGLDATSHRWTGLSALAFLLAALGIHFVLSDALALSSAVASAVPLLGALIAGATLLACRQMLTIRQIFNMMLSSIMFRSMRRVGRAISASDSVLQDPMFRSLHTARTALMSAVGLMLGGYVVASVLLGLAPQSQVDGETVLDFIGGVGTDNLLRSAGSAANLLADGMFWLQALRTLTSIVLVVGAVGAVRFLTVVRDARRRYGPESTGEAATIASGATAQ